MAIELVPDTLRPELAAAGLELRAVPLHDDNPGGLLAGRGFVLGGVELVYRLYDPQTVLIAHLGRQRRRAGLRNPFAVLGWFLDFLHARPHLGVKRVIGLVRTHRLAGPGDLDDARLTRYYQRWLGARHIRLEGNDFVALDLADYRPRARRGGAPAHP